MKKKAHFRRLIVGALFVASIATTTSVVATGSAEAANCPAVGCEWVLSGDAHAPKDRLYIDNYGDYIGGQITWTWQGLITGQYKVEATDYHTSTHEGVPSGYAGGEIYQVVRGRELPQSQANAYTGIFQTLAYAHEIERVNILGNGYVNLAEYRETDGHDIPEQLVMQVIGANGLTYHQQINRYSRDSILQSAINDFVTATNNLNLQRTQMQNALLNAGLSWVPGVIAAILASYNHNWDSGTVAAIVGVFATFSLRNFFAARNQWATMMNAYNTQITAYRRVAAAAGLANPAIPIHNFGTAQFTRATYLAAHSIPEV